MKNIKWLVFIVMFFITSQIAAQQTITYTPMNAPGYNYNYVKIDSGMNLPNRDTTTGRGTRRGGSMVFNPTNRTFYGWDGIRWSVLGSGGSSGQFVDSITVNGANICQWKQGVPTCYIINTGGGTFTGIDSLTYVGNSICWWKNGAPTCYSLIPGVDSVTVVGDLLCQWVNGTPTCFTITGDVLGSGIDSVTVIGDQLCQWTAGTSICYTINNTSSGIDSITVVDTTMCTWSGGVATCFPIGHRTPVFVLPDLYVDNDINAPYQTIGRYHDNGFVVQGAITKSDCWKIDVGYQDYWLGQKHFVIGQALNLDVDTADVTNGRYDIVVVDTFGIISIITGTPSATPIIPSHNLNSQLVVGTIFIPANASCLDIQAKMIYDENLGTAGGEFDATVSGTITGDYDNTANPYHLTKDAYVQSHADGASLIFTDNVVDSVIPGMVLKGAVYINGLQPLSNWFKAQFLLNGIAVSDQQFISTADGLNSNDSSNYQLFGKKVSDFNFFGGKYFDEIIVTLAGDDLSGARGFYLDWFQLQWGLPATTKSYVDSTKIVNSIEYYYKNGVPYPAGSVGSGSGTDTTFYNNDGTLTGGAFSNFRIVHQNGKAVYFEGNGAGLFAINDDGSFSSNLPGSYPFMGTDFSTFSGNGRVAFMGDYGNVFHSSHIIEDDSLHYIELKNDSIRLKPIDLVSATSGMVWQLINPTTGTGHWASAGGTGNTNSNIGSGFRLAVPNTNNVKTLFAGNGLLLDSSSNTNALTGKADTSIIATLYRNSLKVNISDTATMLLPYHRNLYVLSPLSNLNDSTLIIDTSKFTIVSFVKNAAKDSIILTFADGRRLAVKDSSGTGVSGWAISGNVVTSGVDFIGSTNNTSVRHRTNNIERMIEDSLGNLLIGDTTVSKLSITNNTIAAAQDYTNGLTLANNTPATVGAVKLSPTIHFRARDWNTTAVASQPIDVWADLLPVQTTNATGYLRFGANYNNGAVTNNILTIGSSTTGATPTVGIGGLPSSSSGAALNVTGVIQLSSVLATTSTTFAIQNNGTNIFDISGGYERLMSGTSGIGVNLGVVSDKPHALGKQTAPTAGAELDITSTGRSFLPPRMTQVQRDSINLIVSSITVVNGGTGYTSNPSVTFSAGPIPAPITTATVLGTTRVANIITAVTLLTSGSYNSTPTITVTGGGGSGAILTPVMTQTLTAGMTIYCTNCTATDTSTGVMQTWNGSAWKNNW